MARAAELQHAPYTYEGLLKVQIVDYLRTVGKRDCQNATLIALAVPVAGGDLNG